jgi:hypothetical protein
MLLSYRLETLWNSVDEMMKVLEITINHLAMLATMMTMMDGEFEMRDEDDLLSTSNPYTNF